MNIYLVGAVAAAFLALAGFASCEHRRANANALQAEVAEAATKAVVSANEAQGVTIASQDKALQAWKALGKTPEQLAELMEQRAEQDARLAQLQAKNAKLMETDNALPDCVALLKVDYGRICPARGRILRK